MNTSEKPIEVWRPVVGYEGLYEVSNKSNVRSVDRYVSNNWKNGLRIIRGRPLSPAKMNDGFSIRYLVRLTKNGKGKMWYVYRLSALAFPEICGEWFEGAVVDHKDGNTLNNNIENLEFVPQSENMKRGHIRETQHKAVSVPVFKKDIEGNIVDKCDSITEAARKAKISRPSMLYRIEHHTIVNGYVWCKS